MRFSKKVAHKILKLVNLPLKTNIIEDQFKIYLADIGLLVVMNEQGTLKDILTDNLYIYKGAIFENLFVETFNIITVKRIVH